jgi:phosphoesterase RecJ-like protein
MHKILEKIKQAKHIALIVHVNPDADSMGSASAFYSYILQIQKKVTLFSHTKSINKKLMFLPWVDKLKHTLPPSCDMFISFDCANSERLGVKIDIDINFDHHKSNTNFAQINYVDTKAISTTQVLYDYFISTEVKINPKMATALYAGLIDDSQNFMSDKTDAKTFDMAKVLLEKGANNTLIIKNLFQTSPLSLLRLKGLMFSNMQLMFDARVVIHLVTKDMLASCGATCRDCEDALQESLYLPTVSVSYLLCELDDGSIKGSIRTDGTIDASMIASNYKGGGHLHAAGFSMSDIALAQASEKVLSLIKKDILEKKK